MSQMKVLPAVPALFQPEPRSTSYLARIYWFLSPFSGLLLAGPGWGLPPVSHAATDLLQPQQEERQHLPIEYPFTVHPSQTSAQAAPTSPGSSLDLDPQLIENSPLLQRWLQNVPDVLEEIQRDPSFRSRLRLGYSYFPSTDGVSGWHVGVEDMFVGRTGLTLSADYQATFNGKREAWGTDLRYYVRPLGSYINVAPVLGYRRLETSRYTTAGLNVGVRLLLAPARTGAADISLTQSWVAPGTDAEVGLTTLSFGYALTHQLRLSTDLQKQNARQRKDSRVGISLEWMF